MKIKVAIVDIDENYKSRLLKNLQLKYPDKLELYIFSDMAHLYSSLQKEIMDIVLIDSKLELDKEQIPHGTVAAYLCDMVEIEEYNNTAAICKYQKIETIYKQIIGLYAENISNIKIKSSGSAARIVLFFSAQGGSGVSSVAAAYALNCARRGKQVCYLNLEPLGKPDIYFSGDGSMSFSDVIYALKSRKNNLVMKLESAVKTDASGVDFFDTCKNAYDMMELKDEELGRLLRGITQVKEYEEIILDISGDLNHQSFMLMSNYADKVVCVTDGSRTGNGKFFRFCEVLRVMEQREEKNILGKMVLLYNRFSSKGSSQMMETPVPVLGGIPRYTGVDERELIGQIAGMDILKQI